MCTQRHGTAQHSTAQACLCVRAEECLIDKDGKCWYIFLKWGITTAFSLLSMPPFSKMHWKQRAFVLTGLGGKKSTYIMKSIFLLFFFFVISCSFGAFGHTCSQPNCFPLYFLSFSVVVPLWEVGSRSKSVSVCLKTKEQWNIQPSLPEQISFFFPLFLFFLTFRAVCNRRMAELLEIPEQLRGEAQMPTVTAGRFKVTSCPS